jgi:hypothetical protein
MRISAQRLDRGSLLEDVWPIAPIRYPGMGGMTWHSTYRPGISSCASLHKDLIRVQLLFPDP